MTLFEGDVVDKNSMSRFVRHRLFVSICKTFQTLERQLDHMLGRMTVLMPLRFRVGFSSAQLGAIEKEVGGDSWAKPVDTPSSQTNNREHKSPKAQPSASPSAVRHSRLQGSLLDPEPIDRAPQPMPNVERYRSLAATGAASNHHQHQQAKLLALSTGISTASVHTPGQTAASVIESAMSPAGSVRPEEFKSRRARQFAEQYRHLLAQPATAGSA